MSEEKEIVEVDPKFKYKISKIHGAENLMKCFQCGTCTADCPIGLRVKEFRPRQIARLAILGLKEALLAEDTLWLCSQCYTCYERCPQEVKPTEVITALRTLAVKEGYLHKTLFSIAESIGNVGYLYELTDFENEIRTDIGLPVAPKVNLKEVKQILKKTGFDKLTGIELEE